MTTNSPPSLPQTSPTTHRFRFSGTGLGYFKIWIVNLVLTIITLGFYSPWAKVRRLRYFYGHTKVDGRGFDFVANPKRILIGRLIAIVLYLIISTVTQFSVEMTIAGLVLIFAIMPWLLRSTLRFMTRNSQYNNVRFGFNGSLGMAYGLMIAMLLLNVISFGLLIPVTWWMFKRYQFDNTYFGKLKFSFHTTIWDMYKATLLPMALIAVLACILAMITYTVLNSTPDFDGQNSIAAMVYFTGSVYLATLLIVPLMQGYVHQAIWGKLTLGDNRFHLVNFSPFKFAFISLTNYLATLLSIGLLHPWAVVRMHRYKTQTLCLIASQDFKSIATPSMDNVSPVAEEIADVFDFDVSW